MNRKPVFILLSIISVFAAFICLTSCIAGNQTLCWYAYFDAKSLMFGYNVSDNTLYAINLPTEDIANWAKENKIQSMDTAIREYTGIREKSFFTGHKESYLAICTILETIGSDGTPQGNLDTFVKNIKVLSKQPVLGKINRLCGTSCESLIKLINRKNPKAVWIDSSKFIKLNDGSSRQYMQTWLKQTLY